MTDQQHQWGLILRGAIPASIAVAIIFANVTSGLKWALLLLCMGAAIGIVYLKSKRKADLFTAAALVFLLGLLMHFLTSAGFV